jgi:hypothetical protein
MGFNNPLIRIPVNVFFGRYDLKTRTTASEKLTANLVTICHCHLSTIGLQFTSQMILSCEERVSLRGARLSVHFYVLFRAL